MSPSCRLSRLSQLLLGTAAALVLTTAAHGRDAAAPTAAAPSVAPSDTGGIEEVIVTARKREETIQTVPVAVTALSAQDLKDHRVDSGADIELSVPNMSFSRASFGAVDYQIRGIGYQVVSTAADTGVSVHENNAPLIVNRVADSDFYDLQRVEVLRGPQGTLFGRNATGGVINVLTQMPTDQLAGSLTAEYGNYDTVELRGFVNAPIADGLNFRLAGLYLNRDGFQYNAELNDRIDGRNLYSYRASLEYAPTSNFHTDFMWEHFQEADDRFGGTKFVCAKDPGPTTVGGVAVTNAEAQGDLSRGCLNDSIYSKAAQTGTVNTLATLTGALASQLGLITGDGNANTFQPAGPRTVDEGIDPTYQARNDLYEINSQWDIDDTLKLTSLASFSEDRLKTRARFEDGAVPFNVTPVTPGGVFTDPQMGASQFLNLDEDYDNYSTTQWSEEVRLQSSFDGPVNFNLGVFYLHLKRFDNIFILSNGSTAATQLLNLFGLGDSFVDPSPVPDGSGHDYYNSQQPYSLQSLAAFGEVYWKITDELQATFGFRFTDDKKDFDAIPIELLAPGKGVDPATIVHQRADFSEPTGRFILSWSPKLDITDASMFYASYSRGYKGGGFNAPNIIVTSPTYAPEFVNAFEVGTKNTLDDNRLTLNLTGFYYDYKNYQISQVEGLNEDTANVDAKIKGLEFESQWLPLEHLQFDVNLGYLDARIAGGSSIDIFDRTRSDPNYTYLKTLTSACIAPTAQVAQLIKLVNAGTVPASVLTSACPTADAPNGAYASSDPAINPLAGLGVELPTSAGIPVSLDNKDLPNAPHYTISLGVQYAIDLPSAWEAILHAEYYRQGASYADIYNDAANAMRAWDNVNLTLNFEQPDSGFQVQLFAKNVFNSAVITGVGVDSESLGLSRSVTYLDPRLVGISVTKAF